MTLRELRKSKGLTQEDLERLSGVEQTTISGIETGSIKSPSWETVGRLCVALEADPQELFPVSTPFGG